MSDATAENFDSLPLPDPHDEIPARIGAGLKSVNILAIVLPFAGLVAGIVLLWGRAFNWVHLGLLLGMCMLTGTGITVGFHRLFTHRSFHTTRPIQAILALFGSMAVEGPLIKWVAVHRRHHQHSDKFDDPHSPHLHGGGFVGLLKGLWHAHVGWFFLPDSPSLHRYVPDLLRDGMLRRLSKLFTLWVILGLAIPALLGGLIAMSWTGALLGFLWGGLARVFLVHHVTWSINSVCHFWGTQPFRTHDQSRNNAIFGLLSFGEGWHNNHHAFPTSARHGLRWWELDLSYLIIRTLQLLRLARDIKLPTQEAILAKRIT